MTRPKRSLSQNFLVDHNLRRKLVETLGAASEDVVLEVGPGHGELSELLVGRVRRLILVEKDDRLAPELGRRWGGRDDVQVVHGDALEVDLSSLLTPALDAGATGPRLISNLPYAITSPLLFRLLDVTPPAARIVVLVQDEVARRITSDPGCKEYGALTVGVRTQARAKLAFTVSRNAFRPVPGVDSAALVLEPVEGPGGEERERLRTLVRAAFSRRRKQLRTILRSAPAYELDSEVAEAILAGLGIDPRARPETLSPGQFVALAERLEAHPGVG